MTLLTLIIFLLFRLPALRRKVRFDRPLKGDSAKTAGGAVFAVAGLLTLSAPLWVAQTHMEPWISGVRMPLAIAGVALTLCGVALLALETRALRSRHPALPERSAAIQ